MKMRIAAYCRVSTGSDEQLESLKNQETFFRQYSETHGYELANIYADEGISGKQASNRTQFLKMIDDAQYHLFDMVVVKDISRFARNTVDFLNAVRRLKSIGVDVQFLSNNQTVLGGSEFVLTIFSALAQEESASLSKRVKFGKRINARAGRVPNFIYGYDRIDTFHMAVNPEEAKIVRMIFDLYLKGYGCRLIALTLSELKIPTKRNAAMWMPKTIRRILANPVYAGTLVNNLTESKDFLTGTKLVHTPDQFFYHARPELQIVAKEQFEQAQAQMERRREIYQNKTPAGRFSGRYVFSNLIQCGNCGSSYGRVRQTYRNTFIRWRCTGRNNYTSKFCGNGFQVDERELVDAILCYFKSCIADKAAFLAKMNGQIRKQKSKNVPESGGLPERFDWLMEKYKLMYVNGIIGLDELKRHAGELEKQKRAAEAEYGAAERTDSAAGGLADGEEGRLDAVLNGGNLDNELLRSVLEKITVGGDGLVRIYLKK